jgi:hypothetical protein
LEQNAQDTLLVPYRENRAVLFESRLFHQSDIPDFRQGYEDHRINITLLFGDRGLRHREELGPTKRHPELPVPKSTHGG